MKNALYCVLVSVLSIKAEQFEQALVRVPVADVSSRPLSCYGLTSVVSLYEQLPWAPDKCFLGCLRIHQLKFNELVTIKRHTSEHEYECMASNFIYTDSEGSNTSTFWVLKKHLIPAKDIDRDKLPPPIDKSCSPKKYNRGVLTLTWPWYDAKTKKTYSVGTRFARCQKKMMPSMLYIFLIPKVVRMG